MVSRSSEQRRNTRRRGRGRGIRGRRNYLRHVAMTTIAEPVQVLDADDSCIDLTSVEDEQFVDLTSSQNTTVGANDSSVVVIGSPNDSPPGRRQRRQQRRLPPIEAFDDDDSLLELPPVPFNLPPLPVSPVASSSNINHLLSPEAIKITCPVCLDDDKTIKRDKRKLASTTCGHVFCNECIEGSINSQKCCPVCRKKLTKKDVHLLHI